MCVSFCLILAYFYVLFYFFAVSSCCLCAQLIDNDYPTTVNNLLFSYVGILSTITVCRSRWKWWYWNGNVSNVSPARESKSLFVHSTRVPQADWRTGRDSGPKQNRFSRRISRSVRDTQLTHVGRLSWLVLPSQLSAWQFGITAMPEKQCGDLLARDAFRGTYRRVIVMMFVRLSVCLSVWDGRVLWSFGAC